VTADQLDQFLWLASRGAALTAFFVLAGAVLTGVALRSALLGSWSRGRELSALHQFLTILWVPLVLAHVGLIVADRTAHLRVWDAFIPFQAPYGTLAIGLGTVGFDLLIVVTVTAYLRRSLGPRAWRWLHRLSYVMFALFFAHAQLAGTDLARPVISAAAWGVLAAIGVLSLARVAFGRLPN
jgi:predicted ferric reductase